MEKKSTMSTKFVFCTYIDTETTCFGRNIKDTDMKSAYSSDLIFVVLVTSKINKTLVLDVIPDVGIPGKLPYKPCST